MRWPGISPENYNDKRYISMNFQLLPKTFFQDQLSNYYSTNDLQIYNLCPYSTILPLYFGCGPRRHVPDLDRNRTKAAGQVFPPCRIKATVGNRPADVLMSVMRGRLHMILSYETDANAEAEMEDMSAILREISRNLEAGAEAAEGLSAELAVRFGLSERLNVVLKSDEPSTLAFRPATIISSNLGLRAMFPSLAGSEDAGSEDAGSEGNELPTEPFDLEEPAHIERLGLRMDAWALGKV